MPTLTLVSPGLGRGGAETQVVRLACGLKQRGWRVRIVSFLDRNHFVDVLADADVPVTTFAQSRAFPTPKTAVRLARVIRSERPDVVCSFLSGANLVAAPVARALRVPAVFTSVRTPLSASRKLQIAVRAFTPFSSKVVFNSDTVRTSGVETEVLPAGKTALVRNGLDLTPLADAQPERQATRASLNLAEDDFVWLILGNLRAEKNYPVLVRAFREIHAKYPNARLVSAGGFFASHQPVLDAVPDLLESGVIQLLGRRDDVPQLLAAADAFVLPSIYDASPNALIEAMGSGLPCVATHVGGVKEIMPSPAVGILAPTPSHEDVRDALIAMMEHSDATRAAMGQAAKAHIDTQYGLTRMVDEWESLFRAHMAAS